MKKNIVIVIVLMLAISMISIIPTSIAHTEDNPLEITLWAGQNIDVGTVSVWNDEDSVHVEYETIGDWVITETHLYVGKTNPEQLSSAPGQFPFSQCHDPAVDYYPYEIPFDDICAWELELNKKGKPTGKWVPVEGTYGDIIPCETDVYIAAHAVVVSPIEGCYEIVWQIGDVETYSCNDCLTNYANEFNWVQDLDLDGVFTDPVGDCENGPGLGANAPAFTDPFIVGTTPVNEFPYNSNTVFPYATDFDVQWDGELLFGGLLTVSWSPGRSYPTETKILNGDGIPTDTTFIHPGQTVSGQGYFLNTYPVYQDSVAVDPLDDGTHTINFQHPAGDGTFWDWITLEKPCEQWETAWGEGDEFSNNWAMYFTYHIQETTTTVTFPECGTAYIGYEDWTNGDFDYNDFGMTFSVEETYVSNDLTQIVMTFTAVVYDSGMDHLIHINRPLNGGYTYTVTRSTPAYPNPLTLWDGTTGQEKAAGTYTGSGDLDVTLFNTHKYSWPQKQIGETVTITVVLDDPDLNPMQTLTPPRSYNVGSGDFYDLDPIMTNYDPWEEGTLYQCRFHIDDTQVISNTGSQRYYPAGEVIPIGTETPMILVVPYTDWIPPYEDSTITGPYGYFNDFYTTGTPSNWYETITNPTVGHGGLSWS